MILRCIHCGPYELTPEQETDVRYRLSSYQRIQGIQCYRCNEEAEIVNPPKFSEAWIPPPV